MIKKVLQSLIVLVVFLSLTGCLVGYDTTVSVKADEQWTVKMILTFAGQDFDQYKSSIEQSLQDSQTKMTDQGMTVSFKILPQKDGNFPYEMTLSGNGLDKLNEVFTQGNGSFSFKDSNKKILVFHMDTLSISSDQNIMSATAKVTFVLEGGRVISTNGEKVGATKVQWLDPQGALDAEMDMSASGGLAWWIILLIVLGVIGIGVGVLIATKVIKFKPGVPKTAPQAMQYGAWTPGQAPSQTPSGIPPYSTPSQVPQSRVDPSSAPTVMAPRKTGSTTSSAPAKTPQAFCGSCGNKLETDALFCPRCGNRIQAG